MLEVTLTTNRTICSLSTDDELMEEKKQLEDYLVMVSDCSIKKAGTINEAILNQYSLQSQTALSRKYLGIKS
ncbi:MULTISPECIES: hypothetical protein [unclassified Myroides]|uniref:hypothetical protein n=1 Tax=unclassified Myroides TaxID=2642485 RepID=UPI0031012033